MLVYDLINNGKEYAVIGCNKIVKTVRTVKIPKTHCGKSVTRVGDWAFRLCYNLKSITIPDSITSIGYDAFYSCFSLKNVIIPDSVTSVGISAFSGCFNLKSVAIPNSVKVINRSAFYDCYKLTTKKANYKAFEIVNGELSCNSMLYKENKLATVAGDIRPTRWGIHFCTNLFEVFNHYWGRLDKDFVVYECDILGNVKTTDTSLCCTNKLIPRKRLSRLEIINILNNKGG